MFFWGLPSYLTMSQRKSLPSERDDTPPNCIQTTKSARRVSNLPDEVILNIITKVDFSKENFQNLRLASRTFNNLIIVHKTSIIKDIAVQQFPVVSLLVKCEEPTVKWLLEMRGDNVMAEDFLTTCTKRLRPYSMHSKMLAEPRYRRIALIGLHVLAKRVDQSMARRMFIKTSPAFLLDRLPDEILLCISFVGAIISQALERVIKDEPYQDRHDRFRKVADAFLATNGWAPTWNVVVGPTTKANERESRMLKWLREEWVRHFREGLTLVDNDDDDDDDDGLHYRPDLRMKRMVEQFVGKKPTRQKLDLAVIEALQEDMLSEAAIMDLLKSLG